MSDSLNLICKQYQKGKCKYGNQCKYQHIIEQNMKECKFYTRNGDCKHGDQCSFQHIEVQDSDSDNYQENQQQQNSHHKENTANVNKTDHEQKEKKSKYLQLIENMNSQQQEKNQIEHIPFIQLSKHEKCIEIYQQNIESFFGPSHDFFQFVSEQQNPEDIEITRIQRRYMISFQWEQETNQKGKAFTIMHQPTVSRNNLTINFEIIQGYLKFKVSYLQDYTTTGQARISILNESIPVEFRTLFDQNTEQIFKQKMYNIFSTLQHIDNYLDVIFTAVNTLYEEQIMALQVEKTNVSKKKEVQKDQKNSYEDGEQRLKQKDQDSSKSQLNMCKNILQQGVCQAGNQCPFLHVAPKEENIPVSLVQDTIEKEQKEEQKNENQIPTANETNNQGEKQQGITGLWRFRELSKNEDVLQIFENNKASFFPPSGEFIEYYKTLKSAEQKEIAQVMRRYMISFVWDRENQYPKIFTILHQPTLRRDQLDLDFEIQEGWLIFRVQYTDDFIKSGNLKLNLANPTIPADFKEFFNLNTFQILKSRNFSVLQTLQNIDNYLDQICIKVQQMIVEDRAANPQKYAEQDNLKFFQQMKVKKEKEKKEKQMKQSFDLNEPEEIETEVAQNKNRKLSQESNEFDNKIQNPEIEKGKSIEGNSDQGKENVNEVDDDDAEDIRLECSSPIFVNIDQSEEGVALVTQNFQELFNGNFAQYVEEIKTSQNESDMQIAQLQRRYQSSFKFLPQSTNEHKFFEIKLTPTVEKKQLGLGFDIWECFLIFHIQIIPNTLLRQAKVSISLKNQSIPKEFKAMVDNYLSENLPRFQNSAFRLLNRFYNYLPEIFLVIQEKYYIIKTMKQQEQIAKLREASQVKEVEKEEIKKPEIQKPSKPWNQKQQNLLQAGLVQFKDLKKQEQWDQISILVETRSAQECSDRFKEQREIFLKQMKEKQEQKQQEQKESSDEGDSQDEQSESSQSGEDSGEQQDENEGPDDQMHDPYLGIQNPSSESDDDEAEERKQTQQQAILMGLDLNVNIIVQGLDMFNVGVAHTKSVVLSAGCISCKNETQLTLIHPHEKDGNILVNDVFCLNCNTACSIKAQRGMMFLNIEGNRVIGQVGSYTWTLHDVFTTSFELTCQRCNSIHHLDKYVSGKRYQSNCHSCHENIRFFFQGIVIDQRKDELSEGFNQRKNAKIKLPGTGKQDFSRKKIGQFKQGEPLPHKGACQHYSKSFRYFRFPCCGQAYPCDICHMDNQKHEIMMARTMICGFCSREQSFKDECSTCQKPVCHISTNSQHWEGGKGCRNKVTLSRNDPHQYSGTNQTISNKKASQMNQK